LLIELELEYISLALWFLANSQIIAVPPILTSTYAKGFSKLGWILANPAKWYMTANFFSKLILLIFFISSIKYVAKWFLWSFELEVEERLSMTVTLFPNSIKRSTSVDPTNPNPSLIQVLLMMMAVGFFNINKR